MSSRYCQLDNAQSRGRIELEARLQATIEGDRILITFGYDPVLVGKVKTLPDRQFRVTPYKHWFVPASPWHAQAIMDTLGLSSPELEKLAQTGKALAKQSSKVRAGGDKRLYPYQRAAVKFLHETRGRALIADDVGLGKTVEALIYAKEADVSALLVVCPANVLYKWQREIMTWAGKEAQIVETGKVPIDPVSPAWVMTYDIATIRSAELIDLSPELIVLDECHYIKNPKAQRTRAAKLYCRTAPMLMGLSGTPFLNRPIEMFNMLHLINPAAWNSWWDFGIRYCGGDQWGYKRFDWVSNVEELKARLKPYMIRRLKSEVMTQLPPLTRTILPVVIPNKKQYNDVRKQVSSALKALHPESKGYFVNALDRLTALREVVGIGKAQIALDWAKEFLDESEPTKKLVVYAHHKTVVETLKKGLHDYGIGCIIGDTTPRQRDIIAKNFQQAALPRVLIVSSAGGEGIDMFGMGVNDCSNMLIVEREWTSAKEEQAEGRLHRRGQILPVNIWYPVARGTVDEDINYLIEQKRETMKSALGVNEYTSIMQLIITRLREED